MRFCGGTVREDWELKKAMSLDGCTIDICDMTQFLISFYSPNIYTTHLQHIKWMV